jgi:IS605 OrfB family transposase
LSDWIPSIHAKYKNINTNSWFDIKTLNNSNRLPLNFYITDTNTVPNDSYFQQLKSIRRRKLDREPSLISTQKIRLYPNEEQKLILDEWFMAATKMFNITIYFIRQGLFYNHELINIDSAYDFVHKNDFRYILKEKRDKIMNSLKYPIVGHVLDEIINQAVSNYKTCITNLKNGTIKKFRVRSWKYQRRRYILKFEPDRFYNGTFRGLLKNILASSSLVDIQSTTTLQYDRDTKKYILLVPISNKPKDRVTNDLDCGIDLGVRTFASVYSENKVITVGNDLINKIEKCHKKIDKIHQLLSIPLEQKENFVLKKTVTKKKIMMNGEEKIIKERKETMLIKTINRSSLKRALRKNHRKIKNMVRDLHYKTAYYLVKNFDSIYIGKLSTKKILSKNNIKISKETKRMISVLCPYQFRQILKYMGNKYGVNVYEINEYLTTQTCSQCGKINRIGRKKIYKCKCGMKADRDINSGKNMLKVGYATEGIINQDNDLKIYHNNTTNIVYDEKLKKYEIYEI